jgi:hypothetical protein
MIYGDFHRGIAKSKFDVNGFDNLVNCDVHTELGSVRPQLALSSESTTPNENCIILTTTDGTCFMFSTESGKIWKRTTAGVYSLVHTNTKGAHAGANIFNGVVYYATASFLGKQTEALAKSEATWSSQDDDFGDFTNNGTYKPSCVVGSGCYWGDDHFVAVVDSAGTFTADVLDLPSEHSISALASSGNDLLIGTQIGSNVPYCKTFLWDRVSPSFTLEDTTPENGVNCFIVGDNITFAQCGSSGNIYYWTGSKLELFKKIRNVSTSVAPYNTVQLSGRSLFGTGSKVFSIHRSDKDTPYVIVQEYTLTTGSVYSLGNYGSKLLVSTGDNIDATGSTYATATIDTPEMQGHANSITVYYDSYPTGIGISTNVDNSSFSSQTPIVDTVRKTVSFNGGLGKVNTLQGRITLSQVSAGSPSVNYPPIIKAIEV